MRIEHQHWYSHRLGREMGIAVFGHWGPPLLAFPTSGGSEWEYQDQGLIGTLGEFIEAGRLKVFCVNANSRDSFFNKGAHPRHRSWMQRMYDEYVHQEIAPFIWDSCRSSLPIATMGASLGAYHALNGLLKHPDVFKRCLALSGLYDMKRFMDGVYDDNFYFNNPVDYVPNLDDSWFHAQVSTCDIHLATGSGPWEDSSASYRMSDILRQRGIRHSLDDWGPQGGHDWPYWKHQMWEYVRSMY